MSSHSDSLTTLTTAASELEAHLVANVLREHGIEAALTGSFTSQFRAEAPGVVRVLVRQQDLPTARSVLNEIGPARGIAVPTDAHANAPSEAPEPDVRTRLTRWSSWALLAWALFALTAPLVGSLGAHSLSVGLTIAVITALFVAAAIAMARASHGPGSPPSPRQ